jgi:hypothetical protein
MLPLKRRGNAGKKLRVAIELGHAAHGAVCEISQICGMRAYNIDVYVKCHSRAYFEMFHEGD